MTELIFDNDEDWEKRILCVDESCIGTIDSAGRCRECGKPYDGAMNPAAAVNAVIQRQAEKLDDSKNIAECSASDDDWEKRVLCIDEACIGTIGPDGHCRECGKPRN